MTAIATATGQQMMRKLKRPLLKVLQPCRGSAKLAAPSVPKTKGCKRAKLSPSTARINKFSFLFWVLSSTPCIVSVALCEYEIVMRFSNSAVQPAWP